MRRHLFTPLAAVVVGVALVGAACSTGPTTSSTSGGALKETPQRGGTLRFAIEHDPNGLDPTRNAWESSGMQVAVALFDTVMANGADGAVHPYLAESLTPNADFTVWEAKLRPGVSFHDGEPVDADALVTYTEAIRSSLVTGQAASNVSGVQKVDDLTVRWTMHRPWAAFPWILTGQAGALASPRQLADPEGHSHPAGTGPFRLDRWTINEQVRLVRNPNYWRKDFAGTQLPYLEGVDFSIIEDPLARVRELESGRIDLTHDRDVAVVHEYDRLAAEGRLNVERDKGPTETTGVSLNTAIAPFDDLRVREAMALAISPGAIADRANWALDRMATNPIPPSSPWYSGARRKGDDAAEARRLVADYTKQTGSPLAFTLLVASEKEAAHSLVEQWQAVGAQVTIEEIEPKAETLRMVTGKYQAVLQTYFAADDPDILWHFWHSSTIAPINGIGLNFARLADGEIDTALDTARASGDPTVRKRAYAQLQDRLTTLLPQISLYHVDWVIAGSKRVHQARNVSLPDGSKAMPYMAGVFRLTETYLTAE